MVGTELPPTPLFRVLRTPHLQAAGFQAHPEYTAGAQWSWEPAAELCTGCSTSWCSFSREATCALSLPLSTWSRKPYQIATPPFKRPKAFKRPKELPLSCLTKHLFTFKPVCLSFLSSWFTYNYLVLHSAQHKARTTTFLKYSCHSLKTAACIHLLTFEENLIWHCLLCPTNALISASH